MSTDGAKGTENTSEVMNDENKQNPSNDISLGELATRLIDEVEKIKKSNEHVANRIDTLEDDVDALIIKVCNAFHSSEHDDPRRIRQKLIGNLYRLVSDTMDTTEDPVFNRKISEIQNDVEKNLLEIRDMVEHFRKKERDLISVLIINRFTKAIDSAFSNNAR